ncbi:MAG: integration host factor subunit beta [Nitrospirae bacterium RIFOXYB2_FULL_43_5]|nr:MAG: integration host factor subunit beta [Nitrospirae bacterium GWF2_44_13]OGW33767.1 MAG: integration host factor subunit beta [Nitrospirae bacterium GWD2_44_7]OGW65776.1 MAG: integration host factor subunit beta [Nitrospirae bacterium RIFOXYA2_FULL_44_9]OGW73315.1 MAG: integration host factor subunit beta [Nitrospirae bacterium RIFOXYB2_FULL_43_5]OGW73911.1 MAG: integration host factor subunit beta [Nitrospirae bacterium RIFOXYC2_FULL_44_7]HBG92733.1 integration host factor subunit beta 
MTRSVLVDKVSEKVEGLTRKQTEIVMETVFDSIKEALQRGEKIEIRGFGNFRLKTRNPRKARNPKTGESVDVPSKKVLHFKVGKELRELLNSN